MKGNDIIEMKILYITTIGGTMPFFKLFIRDLLNKGVVVDIASNNNLFPVPEYYREWGCKVFSLSCSRSPMDKGNLISIKEIRELVENNADDIVHCHTPIAAACTRIACRHIRKKGSKVYYTAHGFHFYKGAPLKNWILYYPMEWLCAHWTDVLVTINREDFVLAKKRMKAKCIEYVPGIGIDIEKFTKVKVDRTEKRREIGISDDAVLLLSVGELNKNKNHEVVIRALAKIGDYNIHYAIAGTGKLEEYLYKLALELGIEDQIHLLGFRDDLEEVYKIVDLYIHPSYREGLPVALMEAIASKVPVIASNIRGCKDLIEEKYCFSPGSICDIVEKIKKALCLEDTKIAIENNFKKLYNFSMLQVNKKLYELYLM